MASPEQLRRWRLVLGGGDADGTGVNPAGADRRADRALELLYDADRTGGLGRSAPHVARWVRDLRETFPAPVVQVLQRDAVQRLRIHHLLLEPELLEAVQPDPSLVVTLLALCDGLDDEGRAAARRLVRRVVDDVLHELRRTLQAEVRGAVERRARRRGRGKDIDWERTIRANLAHWQPLRRALVVDRWRTRGRRRPGLHHVVLCVDQSGSMGRSVVHAGILAAALAAVPSVQTRLLVFDTTVVDLSGVLSDPTELLLRVRLGGGTDIGGALACCRGLVTSPERTVVILVSDLFEGGPADRLLAEAAALRRMGATVVALLALDDGGTPAFHAENAAALAGLGVAVFGCTPDRFGPLLAAAVEGRNLASWAGREGLRPQVSPMASASASAATKTSTTTENSTTRMTTGEEDEGS